MFICNLTWYLIYLHFLLHFVWLLPTCTFSRIICWTMTFPHSEKISIWKICPKTPFWIPICPCPSYWASAIWTCRCPFQRLSPMMLTFSPSISLTISTLSPSICPMISTSTRWWPTKELPITRTLKCSMWMTNKSHITNTTLSVSKTLISIQLKDDKRPFQSSSRYLFLFTLFPYCQS